MMWKITRRNDKTIIKSGFGSAEEAVDYLIEKYGQSELSKNKFVIFQDLDSKR